MFKAGHVVSVTTWENDADNYKTKFLDGLTLIQANAIAELAKFFTSGTNNAGFDERYNRKVFGNADYNDKFGVTGYRNNFNFDDFIDYLKSEFLDLYNVLITVDSIDELTHNLIGTWCDGDYIRVAESVKIFYIPEDIKEISSFNLRN